MNIFVLDTNPKRAAEYQADTHVVKMVLETAQLLSTAIHYKAHQFHIEMDTNVFYKPTHVYHPSSI